MPPETNKYEENKVLFTSKEHISCRVCMGTQTAEEHGRTVTKEAWVWLIANCQQIGNIPPFRSREACTPQG